MHLLLLRRLCRGLLFSLLLRLRRVACRRRGEGRNGGVLLRVQGRCRQIDQAGWHRGRHALAPCVDDCRRLAAKIWRQRLDSGALPRYVRDSSRDEAAFEIAPGHRQLRNQRERVGEEVDVCLGPCSRRVSDLGEFGGALLQPGLDDREEAPVQKRPHYLHGSSAFVLPD
jgi:hypothetical protein